MSRTTRASSIPSDCARFSTRCGVYRSSIRLRAYGFAISKTLKSGYSSTPTEARVAIALSSITKRVGNRRLSR
jgi:hypothetical protein